MLCVSGGLWGSLEELNLAAVRLYGARYRALALKGCACCARTFSAAVSKLQNPAAVLHRGSDNLHLHFLCPLVRSVKGLLGAGGNG